MKKRILNLFLCLILIGLIFSMTGCIETLTPEAKYVLMYMNWARGWPTWFADTYISPVGTPAAIECANIMYDLTPRPAFQDRAGLNYAANSHLIDRYYNMPYPLGHEGSDGKRSRYRIIQGGGSGLTAECVGFVSASSRTYYTAQTAARQLVINMLIDERTPSRGHRKAILGLVDDRYDYSRLRYVGIACMNDHYNGSFHPYLPYSWGTVIDFAQYYDESRNQY